MSNRTFLICDKCHFQQPNDGIGVYAWGVLELRKQGEGLTIRVDLCPECFDKIKDFLP